jgi:hypothetical protein
MKLRPFKILGPHWPRASHRWLRQISVVPQAVAEVHPSSLTLAFWYDQSPID